MHAVEMVPQEVLDVGKARLDCASLHQWPVSQPSFSDPLFPTPGFKVPPATVDEAKLVAPVEYGKGLGPDRGASSSDCRRHDAPMDSLEIITWRKENGLRFDECKSTATDPELWWEVE